MIKRYPLVSLAYACAAMCLVVVMYAFYEADIASSWIQTPGEVTSIVSGVQGANTSVGMGYRGEAEYMTVTTKRIAYTYQVAGETYHGRGFAENVGQLARGMRVTVRYNQNDPGQSRLEVGVAWHLVFMWLGFAALFLGVGTWWLRYQRTWHEPR